MSIFSPRPDAINPINPNSQTRIPLGPHPYRRAIGSSRLSFEGTAVDKIGMVMTKKAEYILSKLAKKDMPSFTKQDRDPKAKEVYRALKRDHPEYSAGKKARIAESVANKA